MERTCAVLGPRGTFSSAAARRYLGKHVHLAEMDSIEEVFQAVASAAAAGGMVPLENNLAGSINATMDSLEEQPVFIAGEILMPITHCLLAAASVPLSEVEVVISQSHAMFQCQRFLKNYLPGARREIVASTARAAEAVRSRTRQAAAIGSIQMAQIYRLEVIRMGIQDNDNNQTRFIYLSRTPAYPAGADKSSLIFSLKNGPGTLYQALGVFARRNINLTRIESRPRLECLDEYRFFVDIEGVADDEQVAAALQELRNICTYYRYLGSYRAWR